jgi:hypothetical protein
MTLRGNENNVKIVESQITRYLLNMKVFTIYLMSPDYNLVKSNICQLKTLADPADLRLRKKEPKSEKEIKHSFYYVPNVTRDLVIIGFENEIKTAEKRINEFLLRQNTLEFNYSLCFLCPIHFSQLITNFKTENHNLLKSRNVMLRTYDPTYLRKHLNVYLEGKWKDIMEIKTSMFKYFNNYQQTSTKKRLGINDFQQYIYNQEHKLISKNIRKFFIENYTVKNWDLLSDEIVNSENLLKNEGFDNLRNFLQNTDKDTVLNYSLLLPPNGYNSAFGMNRLDFTKTIYNYVEEAYDSYNQNRREETPRYTDVIMKPEESVEKVFTAPIEKDVIIVEEPNESPSYKSVASVKEDTMIDEIGQLNMISNNFSTGIDNIQSTLLSKLNEMMADKSVGLSQAIDIQNNNNNNVTNSAISVNNFSPLTNSFEDTKKKVYELIVNEDINMLINNSQQKQQNTNELENKNISYNFSNINQMNININISNIPEGNKKDDNETFLRRKRRAPDSPDSYNKNIGRNDNYYYKDKGSNHHRKRFHKINYNKSISNDNRKGYRKPSRSMTKSPSPIKSENSEIFSSPREFSKKSFTKKPYYRTNKYGYNRYGNNNDYYNNNNKYNNFERRTNNFEENTLGRNNYYENKTFRYNNNYKPYYHQKGFYRHNKYNNNYYKRGAQSFSRSRSNSIVKEFLHLKKQNFDDFEENKTFNDNVVEIKSNIIKPNNLN